MPSKSFIRTTRSASKIAWSTSCSIIRSGLGSKANSKFLQIATLPTATEWSANIRAHLLRRIPSGPLRWNRKRGRKRWPQNSTGRTESRMKTPRNVSFCKENWGQVQYLANMEAAFLPVLASVKVLPTWMQSKEKVLILWEASTPSLMEMISIMKMILISEQTW